MSSSARSPTGSRVRQVLEVSGRTIDVDMEVTAYGPPPGPTRFATNGIEVVSSYARGGGAGTRLTQSIEARPGGLTARLLVPVLQPRLGRRSRGPEPMREQLGG